VITHNRWNFNIEAFLNSEPIVDANAISTRDTNGEIQFSEFYYKFDVRGSTWSIGLIDITTMFDTSSQTNDETTQFVNSDLVNNPTIEFPDYTLGVAVSGKVKNIEWSLVLAGSHGKGDNEKNNYKQLFELEAEGKGIFAAGEVSFVLGSVQSRFGLWINNSDHDALLGNKVHLHNYGIYAVVEGKAGSFAWSGRVGAANKEVSEAGTFVSLGGEMPLGKGYLGIGVAYTSLADDAVTTNKGDRTSTELYYKYKLGKTLRLTPSVQWVKNVDFDSSNVGVDNNTVIVGLRLGFTF